MVEGHIQVGILASVKLLRTKVELANAEQNLIEASNGLSLARTSFNNLSGRDIDAEVSVKDMPEMPEAGLACTLKMRPELKQIADSVKIAALGVRANKRSRFPVINAFASYNWTGDELFPDEDSWMAGLTLNWDIWDWGRKGSTISQARLKEEQLKDREALLKDRVALEVKKASLDLAASKKKVEVAKKAEVLAEETFRIMNLRFKEGLSTNTDVLEAQFLLVKARTDHQRALYGWHLSQAALERACGIPEDR